MLDFRVAVGQDGLLDKISGLYSIRKDRHGALGLGWFAVRPAAGNWGPRYCAGRSTRPAGGR